jgi:hypothetical protein
MRGLRGQNLRDEQFADDHVRLRLVEVQTATPLPLTSHAERERVLPSPPNRRTESFPAQH